MADEKIEVAASVAGVGKASVGVSGVGWWVWRGRAEKIEGTKAIIESIKLRASTLGPDKLTPMEQRIYLGMAGDLLKGTENQASVAAKAIGDDEVLQRLFEKAPKPALLAAITTPPNTTSNEPSPFDEKTKHWFEQLWAVVGSISDPAIQEWFAKLLSGQLKNPGRFSLKALDVLRTMDEDTAQLFHLFRGFMVPAFGLPEFSDDAWREYGLHYGQFMDLADVGLVDRSASVWQLEQGKPDIVEYQKWHLKIIPGAPFRQIHGHRITRAGAELLTLLEPDYARLDVVCDWLADPRGMGLEISESGADGPFVPWVDPKKPVE